MGYRSEVCIAIYGEPLALQVHLAQWKSGLTETTRKWVLNGEVKPKDDQRNGATSLGLYRLEFHGVKWYSEYEYVQEVAELFTGLKELGLSGEVIRTGEEDDDFERTMYGDDIQYRYRLSRCIVYDY